MFDYMIVGSGFMGSILAERIATQLNKKVLIVEKRNHIGGNAYDSYDENGILIHKYGPHIFHTNNKKVFNYLSDFTKWRLYQHRVLASVDGKLLPIPINMDTINQMYGLNLRGPDEVHNYFESVKTKISSPANAEEMVISQVGVDLYQKFFKGYTLKQWGIDPKDLSASITARIPTRLNRDDRYFSDVYQVIPRNGYTSMFNKIIKHENISILLQTDYKDIRDELKCRYLIYTGPIDEFFDYQYGKLSYRSLLFEHETHDKEYFQKVAQINYPNNYDFTRITEWKHLTGQKHQKTSITKEYPVLATEDMEKYYPILSKKTAQLYDKYKNESKNLPNVLFCGRLGEYKYYNMDQVVARALHMFEKIISVDFI